MSVQKISAESKLLVLFDQLVVSGGNFIALLFIGRRLATVDFGLFSLAMMSTLFLANLHRALFTQPLNILGAAEAAPRLASRMLALLRTHLLAIPVAIGLLIILSVWFFPYNALLFGCCCYVAGLFLQEMLRRYWYTKGQIKHALTNDLISYGGQLLLLILADMIWPIDGPTAFIIMAITSIAAFLFGLRKMEMPEQIVPRAIADVLTEHWALSGWLMLTVLAVWGGGQIYPFLIAPLGPVAVASFAACRNLLNAMGVIVQSIDNYLPIRAAALLRQRGKIAFRRHLVQTLFGAAFFGLLFLLFMLLFAEMLIHFLYNGIYDVAAPVLRILALGTFFALMGAVLGAYSLAMEDSRSSFLANLGATVFTFTVGLWLIHAYGINGAAAAASLSLAVSMVLQGSFVFMRLNSLPIGDTVHA